MVSLEHYGMHYLLRLTITGWWWSPSIYCWVRSYYTETDYWRNFQIFLMWQAIISCRWDLILLFDIWHWVMFRFKLLFLIFIILWFISQILIQIIVLFWVKCYEMNHNFIATTNDWIARHLNYNFSMRIIQKVSCWDPSCQVIIKTYYLARII